jgi:hypothetical protein
MASFVYETLDRDSQEIRLVTILPAARCSTPIECTIRKVSLKDAPTYTALSYAWGDPGVTTPVLVNGVEFQVTTNLESAFRHIRDDVNPLVLWTDAICINQSDTIERNHQLQLMRHIYSNANVLVWLGDEKDDSDQGMEFVENWGPRLEELLSGDIPMEDLDSFFDPKAWEVVHCLLNRTWWKRLWTLQEVVLGREVTVMCGYKTLPWDSFFDWLRTYLKLPSSEIWKSAHPSVLHNRAMINNGCPASFAFKVGFRASFQTDGVSWNLLRLLESFRECQTTDRLDKVYALLGLAADSSDFMEPDYTHSTLTVYSSIAHTLIQRDGALDILHNSGIGCLAATDSLDLPSWVPNWAFSDFSRETLCMVPDRYCATRQTKAMIRLSSGPSRCLLAHGIIHGRICSLSPPGFIVPDEKSEVPLILRTWKYDPKTYSSGIPRLQQFFRTLLQDYDGIAEERLSLNNESFYDLLTAFIYYWIQLYEYFDPSSHFAKWMGHIAIQSQNGCLDITDLEPFIGKHGSGSEIKWCGEIEIENRGALHCLQLAEQLNEIRKMSFILTERDYMGLAPPGTKIGDIVCVLLGYKVPIILRQVEDHYLLVGDSFVYGLMDGEALQDFIEGNVVLTEFTIS